MALSVVLHRVRDYDAWRQVYDSVADMQKAGGVTREAVYRLSGDPNNVLVLHWFDSMEAAESFFNSPELQGAMQRAGVEGMPRIELYDEA